MTFQTINDMKSTIAALGGITDATVPDRAIAASLRGGQRRVAHPRPAGTPHGWACGPT